jgi:hypothetical protein
MIVRIIVSSKGGPCVSPGGVCVSPGGVCVSPGGVCVSPGAGGELVSPSVVVGGGGWPTAPTVGISPARIEVDSAHISASAIANRFMDVAPLRLRNANAFT